MPYPDFRGCLKSLSASPEPLKHKASGVMTYKRTTGAGFCLAEDRSRRTSKANAIQRIGVNMSEHTDQGTKFGDMSPMGKLKWTLKLVVALATFGFVYPNIMHD